MLVMGLAVKNPSKRNLGGKFFSPLLPADFNLILSPVQDPRARKLNFDGTISQESTYSDRPSKYERDRDATVKRNLILLEELGMVKKNTQEDNRIPRKRRLQQVSSENPARKSKRLLAGTSEGSSHYEPHHCNLLLKDQNVEDFESSLANIDDGLDENKEAAIMDEPAVDDEYTQKATRPRATQTVKRILADCRKMFEFAVSENEVFNHMSEHIEDIVHQTCKGRSNGWVCVLLRRQGYWFYVTNRQQEDLWRIWR
jgi:hypothetical protein